MNAQPSRHRSYLLSVLACVLVQALSFLLLIYVGYGEAYRTYPVFEIRKLAAQAEIVQRPINTFLLAGLPLEQFPGFTPLSAPLLASDSSISAVTVADARGTTLFSNVQPGAAALLPRASDFAPSRIAGEAGRYSVAELPDWYLVTLDLANKFETVGTVQLLLPRAVVTQAIQPRFITIALAALVLLCGYAAAVAFLTRRGGATRALTLTYGLVFLLQASIVTGSLVTIYSHGIQRETAALGNSLRARLDAPRRLGLDLADFDGLPQLLQEYKQLNPNLSRVALTQGDRIMLHTDPQQIGQRWQPDNANYEYAQPLVGRSDADAVVVHVAVPRWAVYRLLWRSVKNFVVLFAACAFLSLLCFNLIRSVTEQQGRVATPAEQQAFQLNLIRPLYFLIVFAEGLAASFLPQYLQGIARASGAESSSASFLFTTYFLAFVVALLPAGRVAERGGVRRLLIGGALTLAAGLALTGLVSSFAALFVLRALVGASQGMLLVAVQSYILQMSERGKQTRGAAIIVFGYNGGMISGTAIGALLAVYLAPQGVFLLAGGLALLLAGYALLLIPAAPQHAATSIPTTSMRRNIGRVVKDMQFLKATLLIGIPTKAVLTGVTMYALPLILSRQHYQQEDIGQILMLYSGGVLLSSSYVARIVDRIARTSRVLLFGALGSGLGLILIGLMGWGAIAQVGATPLSTGVLVAGMAVLGIAHGLINAPIVTHVTNTAAAEAIGPSSAGSLYRLLERIGHVSGPLIVAQLLLLNNENAFVISWIGIAILLFGVLFALNLSRVPRALVPRETLTK